MVLQKLLWPVEYWYKCSIKRYSRWKMSEMLPRICSGIISQWMWVISFVMFPFFSCKDKGDYYHPTCFICSQCHSSIASKSFYHQAKSDDRQSDAKFLCENCHIKNAQECAECKNKIVSGEASKSSSSSLPITSILSALVGFEGKQYHRSCFICQNCKNEIGTAHFFKTKDGKYICQNCSHQQQDLQIK